MIPFQSFYLLSQHIWRQLNAGGAPTASMLWERLNGSEVSLRSVGNVATTRYAAARGETTTEVEAAARGRKPLLSDVNPSSVWISA